MSDLCICVYTHKSSNGNSDPMCKKEELQKPTIVVPEPNRTETAIGDTRSRVAITVAGSQRLPCCRERSSNREACGIT